MLNLIELQSMATKTTTSTTKKKKTVDIREAYVTYVLLEGKKPKSVFAFCHENGIDESTFYQTYTSFEHIEEDVWKALVGNTLEMLRSSEDFATYSAREKVLGFYFTFFQEALNKRSFVRYSSPAEMKDWRLSNLPIKATKDHFSDFAEEVLASGVESGEIANRDKINNYYKDIMWMQFQFLISFWNRDNSQGFEKTDAAIEKSVNVWFDLIERGALESALDFGKFMFQQMR